MATERPTGADSFYQMSLRMAWTVCASLPVPVVLLFVLAQFRALGSDHPLGAALYRGLEGAVPIVCVGMILARAFATGGLAIDCFRWPAEICRSLCANAWTLVTAVGPLIGAAGFFHVWRQGLYADSVGRLSLMVAMFLLGQSMWETGSAIVKWEAARPKGTRTVLFAGGKLFRLVAVGAPMGLVFLAAVGYRFAAEQLASRLVWMWMAGSVVFLITGLVARLVELHRSRLAEKLAGEGNLRQQLSELNDNSTQVFRLLRATTVTAMAVLVCQLWSDVIPLGAALDRFQLWSLSPPGDAAATAGAGGHVTVRHLFLAGAVFALTLVVSRNLPGLIQLLMPGSLPLDKGGRYAVTFVARYVVGLTGLVEAALLLGFQWDRVQWLVAGLTVGLGFGLQEVFANLVSGLIILMERPIRVGDSVSVNSVSGTVTKMALRATTILDADRREWIVPNRKFITDDVMNWTLSDTVSRAVFPVAVGHGSDTLRAQEILLAAARDNPLVLDYPEPSVVLARIGGASLDFELRVFLASRSVFTEVQNGLLFRIEKDLREAGIDMRLPPADGREPPPRRRRRRRQPVGAAAIAGNPSPARQPSAESTAHPAGGSGQGAVDADQRPSGLHPPVPGPVLSEEGQPEPGPGGAVGGTLPAGGGPGQLPRPIRPEVVFVRKAA